MEVTALHYIENHTISILKDALSYLPKIWVSSLSQHFPQNSRPIVLIIKMTSLCRSHDNGVHDSYIYEEEFG